MACGSLEDGVEVGAADAAVVGDGFDGEIGVLSQHPLGFVDAQGGHPLRERLKARCLDPCQQVGGRDAKFTGDIGTLEVMAQVLALGDPVFDGHVLAFLQFGIPDDIITCCCGLGGLGFHFFLLFLLGLTHAARGTADDISHKAEPQIENGGDEEDGINRQRPARRKDGNGQHQCQRH